MFANDLLIATAIIGALAGLAFIAGRQVHAYRKWLFISTIFIAVVFSNFFQGNLGWANLMPHSSAVLLSNLTPILVAFIAGFSCNGMVVSKRSRPFLVSTLSVLGVICLVAPLIRPAFAPPSVNDVGELDGFVILQTHDSTCAPASAATLLRLNGIESSEKEMVGPCLTSEFGTEALGLYRGLKLGARGHGKDVRVAGNDPYLWSIEGQLPNVALVLFPEDEFGQSVDRSELHQLADRWTAPNWFFGSPGEEDGHAVVIVGYADGKWTIADPAIGLVKWSDQEFRARFTGDAIYID